MCAGLPTCSLPIRQRESEFRNNVVGKLTKYTSAQALSLPPSICFRVSVCVSFCPSVCLSVCLSVSLAILRVGVLARRLTCILYTGQRSFQTSLGLLIWFGLPYFALCKFFIAQIANCMLLAKECLQFAKCVPCVPWWLHKWLCSVPFDSRL